MEFRYAMFVSFTHNPAGYIGSTGHCEGKGTSQPQKRPVSFNEPAMRL